MVENEPINQLHGSASSEEAEREIEFFFPKQHTLAVIKPDAMEGHRGTSLTQPGRTMLVNYSIQFASA